MCLKMSLRIFLLFCWLWLLPCVQVAAPSVYAVDVRTTQVEQTPIEPILGKKKQEKRRLFSGKKWRRKQAEFRPVWDIVLMYSSAAGAVLLPFGLVFLGWGIAAALLGLWLTGAILSAILALSLLFFYLSFRRNESTSDAWLERYSWRLAVAVLALAALAVFIGGLIGGLLVVWLPALLVFVALAGLLTWLQLRG